MRQQFLVCRLCHNLQVKVVLQHIGCPWLEVRPTCLKLHARLDKPDPALGTFLAGRL